jgi:hypothetical protein
MPAAIWATPMARVRLGRFARPCMRLRQGLGPLRQAFASAVGRMSAMTPSPMRTMAAKCFARDGLVINIYCLRLLGGVVLHRGPEAREQNTGVLRLRLKMTAKDKRGTRKIVM